MLSAELLKKVKQIEIATRRFVDDTMSGQYRTHFRGQGVQFSEHRVYQPGDDVRYIDWKASARSKEALIKKFEEERELTVMLLVDVSASEGFGSSQRLKSEMMAEIGGILAYAAVNSGDKIGAILFTDKLEMIVPPRKGRAHVYRIIRALLSFTPEQRGTNVAQALEAADQLLKHSGVVFVLSDFLSADFRKQMIKLGRRHDVVALRAQDPREQDLPPVGVVYLEDPESGQVRVVDTSSRQFKSWLSRDVQQSNAQIEDAFKAAQVEELLIKTTEDYTDVLVRFFRARNRKR